MERLQLLIRQGFKARLFQAHAALEGKEGGRISRDEIGKRLGKALGTEPVPSSTVASWFSEILPPADVGAGLARVYSVRAGWLYFGDEEVQERVHVKPQPLKTPKELDGRSKSVRRKGNDRGGTA